MTHCPSCQQPVSDDIDACPHCGARLGSPSTLTGMPSVRPGPGATAWPAPAKAAAPAASRPDDDDDDDDDDDEGGGATMMIQALSPEDMARLLGAEAAGGAAAAAPAAGAEPATGDPSKLGLLETQALFAISPSLLRASTDTDEAAPADTPAAPASVADDDDEDDDDDDEQDMPTMALQALDWDQVAAQVVEAKGAKKAGASQGGGPGGAAAKAGVTKAQPKSAGAEAPAAFAAAPSAAAGPPVTAGGPLLASPASAPRSPAPFAPSPAPFSSSPAPFSSSPAPQAPSPAPASPRVVPSPGAVPPPLAGLEGQSLLTPLAPGALPARDTNLSVSSAPPEPLPAAPAAKPAAAAPAVPAGAAAPKARPMDAAPAPASAPAPVARPKKGGAGKILAVVFVLLLLLAAAAAAAVFFFLPREVKLSYESTITHQGDERQFVVQLKVRQDAGPEEPLLLEFEGEQETFTKTGTFRFTVSEEDLEVGSNPRSAVVRAKEGGAELLRVPVDVFLNYRVEVGATSLAVGETTYSFKVLVPEGAKLAVDGATVSGEEQERVVEVDLAQHLGPFNKLEEPEATLDLEFVLTLKDGEEIKDDLRIKLSLPRTELKAYLPAHFLTSKGKLVLAGRIHKDALVAVDGKDAEMWEDGDFEWKQPLKKGSNELSLVARQTGLVQHRLALVVERLTAAELKDRREATREEAEVWAREGAPQASAEELLAGAEGELAGRKFRLPGKVTHVLAGAAEASTLVLSTCAKGCPVLVQAKGALDLERGDKATVYGTLTGKGSFRAAAAEAEVEVPRIDAAYVVGD